MHWIYDFAVSMPNGVKVFLAPAAVLGLLLHFFPTTASPGPARAVHRARLHPLILL